MSEMNHVFLLRKTYLNGQIGYFSEEGPLWWATTPDPTHAHPFKNLKAALRVRRRWIADQYRRALETKDGRECCPVDVVEVHFDDDLMTALQHLGDSELPLTALLQAAKQEDHRSEGQAEQTI